MSLRLRVLGVWKAFKTNSGALAHLRLADNDIADCRREAAAGVKEMGP